MRYSSHIASRRSLPNRTLFGLLGTATCLLCFISGCAANGEETSPKVGSTPVGQQGSSGGSAENKVRVGSKVGLVVQSLSDLWISKEVEVIKASPFFPAGVVVKEAGDSVTAIKALDEFKSSGCKYVVVLAHDDAYNAKDVVVEGSGQKINLLALHWNLYGSDGKPLGTPFVGVHDSEAGDVLAQNILKTADIKTSRCIMIGPQKQHEDFFLRLTATLMPKYDVSKAIHIEAKTNQPLKAYEGVVKKALDNASIAGSWVVVGADDASAIGATQALKYLGAKEVAGYGVGTTQETLSHWKKKDKQGLKASILLNPYPEVQSLAKIISRWESTGTTNKKTLIGGTVVSEDDYESTIKNTIMASTGDKS